MNDIPSKILILVFLLLVGILSIYFVLEFCWKTEFNESMCEEVADEKDRSKCFYDLAMINKDENFCGEIEDSDIKNRCYNQISSENSTDIEILPDGEVNANKTFDKKNTQAQKVIEQYKKETSKGLVGYWNFDENIENKFYDSSVNGNDGIINGPIRIFNRNRVALYFNGVKGSALVYDHPALNFQKTNQFTIDLWIKRSCSLIDKSEGLISKGTSAYQKGYNLNIRTDNTLQFSIGDGNNIYSCFSNTEIDNSNWHRITAIWSGNTLYLYIDDKLDNSEYVGNVNIADDNKPLEFGNHWGGTDNNHPFHGFIDEIKIYNMVMK